MAWCLKMFFIIDALGGNCFMDSVLSKDFMWPGVQPPTNVLPLHYSANPKNIVPPSACGTLRDKHADVLPLGHFADQVGNHVLSIGLNII